MSTISQIYTSYGEALTFSRDEYTELYHVRARNARDFYRAFFHKLVVPLAPHFADPAARRGRKFGLGIGIATQPFAHLDVNTLAQPHTYFVSKLPRQYDRQTIADAFGISEDMFRQTFRFKRGDWLLASYDAAGLETVPIPIHAENAEDRVLEFLAQL